MFLPDGVIGTGLVELCCSIVSLPDDVLLLTGLSGILFPCESIMRPLLLRTRDDCVLCSVCCLIVAIDCVVVFDDTHKPDKSILEPRDSRSRRIFSLSIWTWKATKGNIKNKYQGETTEGQTLISCSSCANRVNLIERTSKLSTQKTRKTFFFHFLFRVENRQENQQEHRESYPIN